MMAQNYPYVCLNESVTVDAAQECIERGANNINDLVINSTSYEFSKDLTFSDQGYFYK